MNPNRPLSWPVTIAPMSDRSGLMLCAECDRGSVAVVLIRGRTWSTTCQAHAPRIVNAALRIVHRPPLPPQAILDELNTPT